MNFGPNHGQVLLGLGSNHSSEPNITIPILALLTISLWDCLGQFPLINVCFLLPGLTWRILICMMHHQEPGQVSKVKFCTPLPNIITQQKYFLSGGILRLLQPTPVWDLLDLQTPPKMVDSTTACC